MRKIFFVIAFLTLLVPLANASGRKVAYNISSSKYHSLSCPWAKKCTKNCVIIDIEEAKSGGEIPCKACGG